MNLTKQIIIALILGLLVGIGFNYVSPDIFETVDHYFLSPVGQIFLRLIQMMVVPIVFVSIVLGTANIGNPKKLGRIGGKTITFFLITTALAITIAITLALIVKPGEEGLMEQNIEEFNASETPSVVETIVNIIPKNPIEAMTSGEMLQIIFFAVFIGFGLAVLNKKTERIKVLFEQANELVFYLINMIMYVAPIGAFGLIASSVGNAGVDAIKSMFAYFMVVLVALFIHAIFVYGSVVKFIAKKSPIWFFKNFAPAMSVAFSTSSS